jgi:hydrogenase expression/formation protein HypD
MRYLDGFRDPDAGRAIAGQIQELGAKLAAKNGHVRMMEVCGTHTMSIARYGIRDLLPANVELVSGPGCPVCVTDTGYIDAAIALAERGHLVATFGDLMRVPGSEGTLAEARGRGADVDVCYSPEAALDLARANPGREIVFLGIGFETTTAPVVSLVPLAQAAGIKNLSLLTAFKLVPPALDALLSDPEVAVHAFICPAHVSAIIGSEAYRPYVDQGVPAVVAGFEPLDILMAIAEIIDQHTKGVAALTNQYDRVVRPDGNRKAQELFEKHLRPVDAAWRGIGVIPDSGLGLRDEFAHFDASLRLDMPVGIGEPDKRCRCGDVLKGIITPKGCPLFGRACTPLKPVGPCMVSSEGSCAAYFKYVTPGAPNG